MLSRSPHWDGQVCKLSLATTYFRKMDKERTGRIITYFHAYGVENSTYVLLRTNFEVDVESVNSGQSCSLKSIMSRAFR